MTAIAIRVQAIAGGVLLLVLGLGALAAFARSVRQTRAWGREYQEMIDRMPPAQHWKLPIFWKTGTGWCFGCTFVLPVLVGACLVCAGVRGG